MGGALTLERDRLGHETPSFLVLVVGISLGKSCILSAPHVHHWYDRQKNACLAELHYGLEILLMKSLSRE